MRRFEIPPKPAPKPAERPPAMPESPYKDNPALKPFHCRNKACKEPVALTDGIRLYVAGMIITQRTVFICAHCGYNATWRPVLEPVKQSK